MYEPLSSAVEAAIRVQIEPEVEQEPQVVLRHFIFIPFSGWFRMFYFYLPYLFLHFKICAVSN